MPAADEERVQRHMQLRRVCEVVADYQDLVQFLHFEVLRRFCDLTLLLDGASQRRLVPFVPVRLLALRVHAQVLLDVPLHWNPAIVDVDAGKEDVDSLKDAPVLLQDQAEHRYRFFAVRGAQKDACARHFRHDRVAGLFARVFWGGEELNPPHVLRPVL